MKKILFAASEAVPFVKTGGLADVAGSLPRYFSKDEYDVRVILPKYACMDHTYFEDLRYQCHFYVDLNWRKQYAGIFKTKYKGVTFYFVDNEFYFAGEQPYNHIYEDVEKFAFFSKAVLYALPLIDFKPDIIHCHDWQTGLLPVFLHTCFGSDSYYEKMKTIMTIHNIKFQGRFHLQEIMDITGLPKQIFNASELECYGEANYLKGGLVYADAISTVSPTYAREIMSPEGGEGLDGLMYAKKECLYGILNGIDYEVYNPEKDCYLKQNFSSAYVVEGKRMNKQYLQQKFGLPQKEDAFLIGIVSRMTKQKGFDLVAYVLEEMLKTMNVQFVVTGTGEKQYENMFFHFANKYPDKIRVNIGYSEEDAHLIYGSCDAFLMPSLYEPCGLSQMMAMRYGTIPIVRETGGLRDTVIPYNEYEETGTGFSFTNFNAHEMLATIRYAQEIYSKRRDSWNKMVKRCMREQLDWKASAEEYEALYDKLIHRISQ